MDGVSVGVYVSRHARLDIRRLWFCHIHVVMDHILAFEPMAWTLAY